MVRSVFEKDSRSSAQARLQALRKLLVSEKASTQEELRHELEKLKFEVNQSTISRDLRRLGAIKTLDHAGNTTYRLPADGVLSAVPSTGLSAMILSVRDNGSMIVITTPPGSASLVARHVDSLRNSNILGTIAGDDTIFIAPASTKAIKNLVKQLESSWSGSL